MRRGGETVHVSGEASEEGGETVYVTEEGGETVYVSGELSEEEWGAE